ncbi:MAG TPA: tRNA (N(6)-L-threonylcarbamoyladenosine(37)-C(2))-methylthiotransferase MtaB [Stellaceae bacterium]|nr:tRNA (N(6)-L-threonylcarbamoyladenosine(37)-C(2))-methylthiotransferase MtaB [Stellaceae bacterium]
MPLEILTFGCRLNLYESEVMRGLARDARLEDAVLVNTCAVTAEAERQARQAIRRAGRAQPGRPIIVTGCAAQLDPAGFAALPGVTRVLGNAEKLRAESWDAAGPAVAVGDIMAVRDVASHLVESFDGHARAFVQVQQGCDHRCSFCVIPLARGNSRSVPLGALVREVAGLVDRGYREVVLTGVDLASYGADLPGAPSLGQLVRRLLAQVPALPRLRLSSLDPARLDEEFWTLLADEPRLMPHLHLSAQAGDDLTLKRMKRRHRRADLLAIADRVAGMGRPIVLGADLIAGFPTETEAMFEATLSLAEACGLTYLHVFPYSPRPGTPAARMPQVPVATARARAALLRDMGTAAVTRFLASRVGSTADALMEQTGIARTEHYAPIRLDRPVAVGAVVPVKITGVTGDCLDGMVLA